MSDVRFIVEGAGCTSCAARIRGTLESLGTVRDIDVDEEGDTATVHLEADSPLTEERVRGLLDEASVGSGHTYEIRVGSWA